MMDFVSNMMNVVLNNEESVGQAEERERLDRMQVTKLRTLALYTCRGIYMPAIDRPLLHFLSPHLVLRTCATRTWLTSM